MTPQTLFDKLWDQHVVKQIGQGPDLLYIDQHLIHEVTSPQAFEGLRKRGLKVFRPDQTLATADHNVPTIKQDGPIANELSRKQVEQLKANCEAFGIQHYGMGDPRQGIVHVIGPELGVTKPGMTLVCGDSHTSTHGAFGCIAFGIGTSEVEMVLANQCLVQERPKTMRITIDGKLQAGVFAKDLILYVISQVGTDAGQGYFVEFAGEAIEALSMEGRMTVCNMSIEMGARGGLIAPDQTTFDYLQGRPFAPEGKAWDEAVERWKKLPTDPGAQFDAAFTFDAANICPMITYGTTPGMGDAVKSSIPKQAATESPEKLVAALKYMDLVEEQPLESIKIDHIFIGSCTNARIEDLREAAKVVAGGAVATGVKAIVVPGSQKVAKQAAEEGLVSIFTEAGFQFREPGCSACLAMNGDSVPAGAYCVSTSNRNFEGRQGQGARTLLASPATAAASALAGRIADPRNYLKN